MTAPGTASLIDVALPVPLFRTFTYAAPVDRIPAIRPGSRVVVPFRNRREMGICVGVGATPPERGTVKSVLTCPDAEPALGPGLLALATWIAEYYVVPLGVVLRSMLPTALMGLDRPTARPAVRRVAALAADLPTLAQREALFRRAPQQRAMFELLESIGGRAPVDHLLGQLTCSASVLQGLAKRGLVTLEAEPLHRDPFASRPIMLPSQHDPTLAQAGALRDLRNGKPGEVFLLHGVTGSGKTLVYIDFLRTVVEQRGQTAIVLVPEIALTPQTVDRFRAVFGDQVAVLHSALSEGERHDAWQALKRGERRIAVGARSAIFAPLDRLGAVIVDEEHESTYKQGEAPRYHAREVAIVRARQAGAVVVLGSATPSLESWTNARSGKYRLLTLPYRAGEGRLPRVVAIDLRRRASAPRPDEGTRSVSAEYSRVICDELDAALALRLSVGEQSILLLNRRGYAAFVQCDDCGHVAVCQNCSISLTYHRTPESMVCHYCSHREPVTRRCARCGGPAWRQRGLGTQQVERLVAERFPAARVARMDVDTTSAKWAHAEILDRVGSGEIDILLGTQMIAKGLDFPNVTLVGVVDADTGINLPDFRASERCFQLLSQVAGRAGRGTKAGEVLVQTRVPMHRAVTCAVAHDYATFVEGEAADRASPCYPPRTRLANVVFSGLQEEPTAALALRATRWLKQWVAASGAAGVAVVGPAPCPIERIKGRWRWHALVKSAHAGELTRIAHRFMERGPGEHGRGLRVTFDRDPVSLL